MSRLRTRNPSGSTARLPTPRWPLHARTLAALASCLGGCAGERANQPEPAPAATPPVPQAEKAEPFDIELANTTATLHMVPIPAGNITVSDPAAPGGHRTLTVGPFWMSQTEVTWDLYDIYVYRLDEADPDKPEGADAVSRPSKPYLPPDRGFGHAGYPAISIAHDAAAQFCIWLSGKTGKHFRLATESEWEFACQGPGTPETTPIDDRAWHSGNANNTTHPVAQKLPNPFGLYDMLGNVLEWTDGLDGKPITCGGSYADAPETLTCQTRAAYARSWQSRDPQIPKSKWWLSDGPFVGFRIVCDVASPSSAMP